MATGLLRRIRWAATQAPDHQNHRRVSRRFFQISTASGIERCPRSRLQAGAALATARGTDKNKNRRMKKYLPLILSVIVPLPWLSLSLTDKAHAFNPALVSLLSGLAIVGAAFLLGWGAELSERDIPRSLALITLALISVLPEYAIGLHYAWTEGLTRSSEGLRSEERRVGK